MRAIIFACLLLACWLVTSCAPAADFDYHLNSLVRPYLFNFVGWEFGAIAHEFTRQTPGRYQQDEEISLVIEYFSAVEQAESLHRQIEAATADDSQSDVSTLKAKLSSLDERKLALQDTVERIIEKQLRETLAEQGIFNPFNEWRVSFPPINFKLEQPPHVLVISPRDRIESLREITLRQDLSLQEIQDIEDEADGLGVSSLVVEIGGLGATYPTFVTSNASLRFTLDTVAEEWLHQYLAFKPLGFLYILDLTGISPDYEIATINETVAGIFSKEIGAIIYQKYYTRYENGIPQYREPDPESDFNREMRDIRKAVDTYLVRGEIEQAEEFMEQKRQHLVAMGYYIRRLNQAYFAFHGTYADSPTSISPIGTELKELRARSASLKDFLETASALTSRQYLSESIR
jgi:hypothetical protein